MHSKHKHGGGGVSDHLNLSILLHSITDGGIHPYGSSSSGILSIIFLT